MKKLIIAAVLSLAASGALAQQARSPANPKPSAPAVATSDQNNPGAPAKGANSFTESQAQSRIAAKGFSHVSSLKKDQDGVWRGTATKNGKSMNVGLDYQGNVVAR